ncbi:MAG: hypothetical protein U0670_10285 [Anaerolineae bacterium]
MEPGLNDFIRQIPLQLFVMLCGSAVLLAVAITAMVGARRARAQVRAGAGAGFASPPPEPVYSMASPIDHGDLPDLDVLTSSHGMIDDVPPNRAPRTGTFTVQEAGGDSVDVVEVLTVLRDVADGGLLIQIGDKTYRNPPALADAEFKRRFNTAISELAKSLSKTPVSAPPKETTVSAPSPDQAANMELPSSDAMATGTYTPTLGMMPGDLPKFKVTEAPRPNRPLGRVPKPTETIPEIDVGGSVEAYLQHKLSMTPQFAGRRVHIRPNPLGGIRIEVDGQFYDAVSDVGDPAVQAFLRSAIEEWQNRQ